MTTKQKIVSAAIVTFNKKGCIASSMRTISIDCGMSLSNLQHHFRTKELLLETIIEEMCLVFEGTADFGRNGISLKLMQDMNSLWFDFQKHYYFFFSEISAILQQYPVIQRRFSAIKMKRLMEYQQLFDAYAKERLFLPEPFPGFFYAQAELLWFFANYYLSTQLAEGMKFSRKTFDAGNKLATNLIYSMLSERGIAELIKLNHPTR
jgi:AcrR family transcriptional regulator